MSNSNSPTSSKEGENDQKDQSGIDINNKLISSSHKSDSSDDDLGEEPLKKRLRDDDKQLISKEKFLKSSTEISSFFIQTVSNDNINLNFLDLCTLRDEIVNLLEDTENRVYVLKSLLEKSNKVEDLKQELETEEPLLQTPQSKKKKMESDKKERTKICGVVNSRGKPCQRSGFCPFHHGSKKKRQQVEPINLSSGEEEEELTKDQILESKKYDKLCSTQISILLVAAAAIEKETL